MALTRLYQNLNLQVQIEHLNSSLMDENGLIQLGMDVGKFYRSFEWDVMGVPARFSKIYYAGNKVKIKEVAVCRLFNST